jgi:hypothetical protein
LGVAIGAVFGDNVIKFCQRNKISNLRLLVYVNLFGIVANGIKLIESFPFILIGRFLFGLSGGMSNILLSKFIAETVPVETL